MGRLDTYTKKRDFSETSEPEGTLRRAGIAPRYSIQNHAATRLHWDLRLEHDGVLLSWAITRGPSLNPKDKRLAVQTEDHPLDYLTFEGTIPHGNYGAGTVMLWDLGWWQPLHDVEDGLRTGHIHFILHGARITGKWSLIRLKGHRPGDGARQNWLMVKESDEAATEVVLTDAYQTSVLTNRSMEGIAADAPALPDALARKALRPKFHPPQLAELHDAPPEGDDWWHEVKLDGYRAQVAIGKGGVQIFTRNGLDWTDKFAALVPSLDRIPAQGALIDGEIVAGAGLERFGDVALAIKEGGPFIFYAFDLLSLDSRDLTIKPLTERRAALERLFADVVPKGFLRLSPVLAGNGADLFEQIRAAGGEGIVSKLRDAPYRSGRSAAWVKSKVEQRGAFAIIGWQHSTARGRPFASLLLGAQEGGRLVYRGKVGTGFSSPEDAQILAAMKPLHTPKAPLAEPPALREKVTWITPDLLAEVRYAEVTRDGHLRHASFLALREDKVVTQTETDHPATRPKIAGIGISHPERIVYPKPSITKLDVAEYYEAASESLLNVALNRPLSLLRLPDGLEGQQFFQKHRGRGFPTAMRQIDLPDAKGKMQDKMYLTTPASILAAVQMGTLEFHIEGVRIDKPQSPDRLIFDLDPDEGLAFAAVRDAAVLVRDVLAAAKLPSWAMVTGGKGVHIVAPLRRTASTQSVALFARFVATSLAERHPRIFTAKMTKTQRKGRIYIDWLRNDAGSTAVAPFSLRAREGAPAAMPVAWNELAQLDRANAFSRSDALERGWEGVAIPKAGQITEVSAARIADAIAAD